MSERFHIRWEVSRESLRGLSTGTSHKFFSADREREARKFFQELCQRGCTVTASLQLETAAHEHRARLATMQERNDVARHLVGHHRGMNIKSCPTCREERS